MIKYISKTITILLIAIFILNMAANVIFAAVEVKLDKAYIEKIGEADYHLKYYREDRDVYTYIICLTFYHFIVFVFCFSKIVKG